MKPHNNRRDGKGEALISSQIPNSREAEKEQRRNRKGGEEKELLLLPLSLLDGDLARRIPRPVRESNIILRNNQALRPQAFRRHHH